MRKNEFISDFRTLRGQTSVGRDTRATAGAQDGDHEMKNPAKYFRAIPVDLQSYYALAKFFAGIITIGGGCSLGREGPTVHIAGALASNIAGMLGVAKQGRRAGYYRVPQQDWRQHSIHLCRRMLNRNALLEGQNIEQAQRPAEVVNPDATIRDAVAKMIDKSVSLLVVISPTDETPIGIVTLHDIFRLQNQLAEAM
jgi:hypothetical protein